MALKALGLQFRRQLLDIVTAFLPTLAEISEIGCDRGGTLRSEGSVRTLLKGEVFSDCSAIALELSGNGSLAQALLLKGLDLGKTYLPQTGWLGFRHLRFRESFRERLIDLSFDLSRNLM